MIYNLINLLIFLLKKWLAKKSQTPDECPRHFTNIIFLLKRPGMAQVSGPEFKETKTNYSLEEAKERLRILYDDIEKD